MRRDEHARNVGVYTSASLRALVVSSARQPPASNTTADDDDNHQHSETYEKGTKPKPIKRMETTLNITINTPNSSTADDDEECDVNP